MCGVCRIHRLMIIRLQLAIIRASLVMLEKSLEIENVKVETPKTDGRHHRRTDRIKSQMSQPYSVVAAFVVGAFVGWLANYSGVCNPRTAAVTGLSASPPGPPGLTAPSEPDAVAKSVAGCGVSAATRPQPGDMQVEF